MTSPSLAVCIATYERPGLLATTLEALAMQTRLPDEIVISDASVSAATGEIVGAFGRQRPDLAVKYIRSERRALPWQRWWAFTHSQSDVVLFLDDDVRLLPDALETLIQTYHCAGQRAEGECVAGAGFALAWGESRPASRNPGAFKERWLGTSPYRPGTVTPGGLTVSLAGLDESNPVPVDYLSGGAMSFRRDVLTRVGLLDRLVALYEAGIGRGEDSVLSSYARRHGRLYLITRICAIHPPGESVANTPYAVGGWRRGMTGTWTRAHILRWLATDPAAYKKDWLRLASLELGRGLGSTLRRPWRLAGWAYLAGALYGFGAALLRWRSIPREARSQAPEGEG